MMEAPGRLVERKKDGGGGVLWDIVLRLQVRLAGEGAGVGEGS